MIVVQTLGPKKATRSLLTTATASTGVFLFTILSGAIGQTNHPPIYWSIRMAESEIARRGDTIAYAPGSRAKWDYTVGLFTLSLIKLSEATTNPSYAEYAERVIGSFIQHDGQIFTYKLEDYNLDNINCGKTILALYERTRKEKYRKAADLLREQLRKHPRTSEGGFWHKKRYPWQMWLDGLYMGAPFYAQYTAMFGGSEEDFRDVVRQFELIDKHLYDPEKGLYYHGWDEKREQEWADKVTGRSSNFWGRAVGWYAMACVDTLDFIPTNLSSCRAVLLNQVKKVAEGIVRWQDPTNHVWWQVLDRPGHPGNYQESSASAMFVYFLLKSVNKGYLPTNYLGPAIRGYYGILSNFIREEPDGKISIIRCCAVAGLGYGRDGSYEYYLREPIVDNDLKAVGPFILAGIEFQKLLGPVGNLTVTSLTQQTPSKTTLDSTNLSYWSHVDKTLARIRPPTIPEREFNIMDFGVVADGRTDCSTAIERAITTCHNAGGGRIVFPAGRYLTGPIHLKSRVNLHFEGGATLLFKTDPAAYLPLVLTRWEGMDCYNYSPLIYAYGQHDIAITGEGVLDGQADNHHWWPWKGKKEYGWTNGMPNQTPARNQLIKMVEQNVPVEQRRFGEGAYLRPNFIQFYKCQNVLIEGVHIVRSPMWEIHPVLCTNVIVRDVKITSHGPNNDGCNPESCSDVLIERVFFDTGDDCIAIKSGRNNDGRRLGIPSQNIVIRNCVMKDGHGGVTIGSEISGGCKNVFVENCIMDSPNLDRALRFKSNAVRGGIIENIFVRSITVGQVADAAIQIDFVYEEGAKGQFPPTLRNFIVENMKVQNCKRVLDVVGFPGAIISNVWIINSEFNGVTKPDTIQYADVQLINCKVNRKPQQVTANN